VIRPPARSLLASCAAAVAIFLLAGVRSHGQDPGQLRTRLYPYPLPPVDQGVLAGEGLGPAVSTRASLARVTSAAAMLDRTGQSGSTYSAGRVIVKFRDGTSSTVRLSSLARMSAARPESERPSYANFDLVQIDANDDVEAVAETLRQRPEVEYAQPAYRIRKLFVPNDALYRQFQWNLPLIDMERAWDIQGTAGSSVTVAVIDTGVAFENTVIRFTAHAFTDDLGNNHPALGPIDVPFAAASDLFAPGRFVAPRDFIWNDDDALDLDGHGTHVSGTLGQLTNNSFGAAGVAFNVKLMPVKVVASDWDAIFGAPQLGSDDTVARGIRYAADNGAKVINLSIGRTGPPSPVIEDAVKYAVRKGTFIAVAGGNEFEDGNSPDVIAEIASRVDGAVSVGAVDRAKNHAFYSTTGASIELVAPGGSTRGFGRDGAIVQQTLNFADFGFCLVEPRVCGVPASFSAPRFDVFAFFGFQGTSMAAPHVAGLAAMLIQQGITDPVAIEAAMKRFATDLGAPGRDDVYGYGLIEARDTLRGLGLAR
jgi:serine protease